MIRQNETKTMRKVPYVSALLVQALAPPTVAKAVACVGMLSPTFKLPMLQERSQKGLRA
jgi:hypothetical protein